MKGLEYISKGMKKRGKEIMPFLLNAAKEKQTGKNNKFSLES